MGQKFEKGANCKSNLFSPVSISAGCDLKIKGDVLKLHEMCSNCNCKFQKNALTQ